METIAKSTCKKIGYFQKPHGVKGELSLIFEPQYDFNLENEPILFLEIDGLLVPYFLSPYGIRFRTSESAIVNLDWVNSEEEARQLTGLSVFLKETDLVFPEEKMTLHHLIGFTLYDSKEGKIGTIEKVVDFGGNLLFQIQFKGKEVLVPFNGELLLDLNESEKTIKIACPEGIFDLD